MPALDVEYIWERFARAEFDPAFVAMDPYADCDGNATFDILGFLCFQDAFTADCP